ncbi:MAG TPA: tetratricopeptide repeat protein, partial [Acidobacteriota bacterium]|nr:tetratricopeptide repeat protein [Acidobacteriota bacterium]
QDAAGNRREAQTAFKQAVTINPEYTKALIGLGEVSMDLKEYPQALEAYQIAAQQQSKNAEVFNQLGIAHRALNQADEAVAAFRTAATLSPNDPGAHNNLGVALFQAGHIQAAIDEYKKAIALKSDYQEAAYNLGLARQVMDSPAPTVAQYRRLDSIHTRITQRLFGLQYTDRVGSPTFQR